MKKNLPSADSWPTKLNLLSILDLKLKHIDLQHILIGAAYLPLTVNINVALDTWMLLLVCSILILQQHMCYITLGL